MKKFKKVEPEENEYIRVSINRKRVRPFGSGWLDANGNHYMDTIDGIVPDDWCVLEQFTSEVTLPGGFVHTYHGTRYRKNTFMDE
ncbi:hypothetical protein [Dipodfec virus UOA04_Rod_626]|nr:hypothetical protein [Dipodfec virus UOA04_Rod_626]